MSQYGDHNNRSQYTRPTGVLYMAGRATRLLDGILGERCEYREVVLKRLLGSVKPMVTRVGGRRGVIDVGVRLG